MGAKKKGMRGRSRRSVERADEVLRDEELALLLDSSIDWRALRPKVADKETFDALVLEVTKATQRNEDLAALKERLQALGEKGAEAVERVCTLLRR